MYKLSSVKAIVLLLFLVAVVSNVEGVCWNCMPQNMSDDEIERILALDFKKRLMVKLGMESEPEVPEDFDIPPREVLSELFPLEDDVVHDEDNVTTQTIFLQALNNDSTVYNTNTTSYFEYKIYSDELNGYRIDHVTLLLYANGHTGPYKVYEKISSLPRRMVFMDKILNASEWKKIVFTPNQLWLMKPWRKIRIEIEGIETPIVHKPLLQLNLKRIGKRVKRSSRVISDCNPNNNYCCKHHKVINLQKYMSWLSAPKTYRAFTCLGDCPLYHRANHTWTHLSQLMTTPKQPPRIPCCVPTAFDPLSILYFNKKSKGAAKSKTKTKANNKDRQSHLTFKIMKDMVVKSCGCL